MFTLTEPRYFECIKVNFLGNAHVQWTRVRETHEYGRTLDREPIIYSGDQAYVQQSLLLWTPQQSSSGTIGPGSFSYQFQFVIPFHVPSSFFYENIPDGISSAYISYEVEGRAVTRRCYVDYHDSVKVYISSPANISAANWTTPISLIKRKQVGCLCYAAGDVEFVAKLPRTGYCVANGDTVSLTVDVHNNSTRAIEMRAKILQKVTMSGQNESQTRSLNNCCLKSLAKAYSGAIQAGESYEWNSINWTVPRLPPTLLECRVVCVEYILEVSAIIPNALNLVGDIPLFMSNLPYCAGTSSEGLNPALVMIQGTPSANVCRSASLPDANVVQDRASGIVHRDDFYDFDAHNSSEKDTLI